MKKIEFFALALTIMGFAGKLIKMPLHTIVIVVGLFLMLAVYMLILLKNKTDRQASAWIGLAGSFWLVFLLFKVKFFAFDILPLALALKCSILGLFFTLKEKTWHAPAHHTFVLGALLSLCVYITPSHDLYYFFNIRLNNHISYDYRTWDKYSWFLYMNNQYEEAKYANQKALKASKLAQAQDEDFRKIAEHAHRIENKNWERFE